MWDKVSATLFYESVMQKGVPHLIWNTIGIVFLLTSEFSVMFFLFTVSM